MITSSKAATISISSSVLAIAIAVAGMPLVAVAPMALAVVLNSRASKRQKAPELGDLSVFVGNLLANYSKGRSTLSIIKDSLDQGFGFYKKAIESIDTYRLSGNAKMAFAWAGSCSSALCREVFLAIAESLDTGTDIIGPMRELYKRISSSHDIQVRSLGGTANAMAIVGMGSVVFFPIFAGISYYIMGFSAGTGSHAAMGYAAYAFMVIFYIAEISIYNNFHKQFDKFSASSILANMAVGIFLFKASYLFALNGIRW